MNADFTWPLVVLLRRTGPLLDLLLWILLPPGYGQTLRQHSQVVISKSAEACPGWCMMPLCSTRSAAEIAPWWMLLLLFGLEEATWCTCSVATLMMHHRSLVGYLNQAFLLDSPINRLSVTITNVGIGNVAGVVDRIQIRWDLPCRVVLAFACRSCGNCGGWVTLLNSMLWRLATTVVDSIDQSFYSLVLALCKEIRTISSIVRLDRWITVVR